MPTSLSLANWLLPLVHLALVIDYGATFFLRIRAHVRSPWVPAVAVIHACFLVLWSAHVGHLPSTGYGVLSLVALSCTVVYAVTELVTRDRRTGVFVFLVVFLLQYTSSVFFQTVGRAETSAEAVHVWGRIHIIAATFAYTALALAALYGALHLLGRRNLRLHHFGLLFDRMPPLELLGRSSRYALLAGFVLMTVSVASGSIFWGQAHRVHPGAAMDSKVLFKIIGGSLTWAICGIAVAGRLLGKWSDSRLSYIAAGGFLAVAAFFVTSLILSQ